MLMDTSVQLTEVIGFPFWFFSLLTVIVLQMWRNSTHRPGGGHSRWRKKSSSSYPGTYFNKRLNIPLRNSNIPRWWNLKSPESPEAFELFVIGNSFRLFTLKQKKKSSPIFLHHWLLFLVSLNQWLCLHGKQKADAHKGFPLKAWRFCSEVLRQIHGARKSGDMRQLNRAVQGYTR